MVPNLPSLALRKPDGSLLTRIEAETELWDKCKTSHTMRRLAWGQFGLDSRYAWILKPTSVTHWVLDELIRKKQIAGDPIGVQPELESDDSYFNSYVQRLKVFVEDGRALMPKEGEGIDMGDFNGQQPPNGQPPMGYAPPPPPMGFPGQQGAPPPQGMAPPQQPPPQFGAPQPGFPPQAPQFGGQPQQQQYAPQQPSFPPQGAPPPIAAPQQQQMPQQMAPQGMMPQQAAPPTPPAQAPSNRRGRGKADAGAVPPGMPNPPVQQQMPFPGAQQPQQAMPQFGAAPSMGAPMQQGMPSQQPAGGPDLLAQIAELKGLIAAQDQTLKQILHVLKGADAVASIMVRGYYNLPLPQQASQLNTEATFGEMKMPYPS